MSILEDLGVQQAPQSTLVSYLDKLLWALTGNFAKQGTVKPALVACPVAKHDTRRDLGRRHRSAMFANFGAVQRNSGRDPHRSPQAVPGDDHRIREPRPLAR
ncbi:hypothetical protein [Kibdelosporangium philippinense]|uniref:hypothetical protein n=1 Tax=Kibdelosporangium philippinense TaxID=211113 RepID=UPI00361ADFD0